MTYLEDNTFPEDMTLHEQARHGTFTPVQEDTQNAVDNSAYTSHPVEELQQVVDDFYPHAATSNHLSASLPTRAYTDLEPRSSSTSKSKGTAMADMNLNSAADYYDTANTALSKSRCKDNHWLPSSEDFPASVVPGSNPMSTTNWSSMGYEGDWSQEQNLHLPSAVQNIQLSKSRKVTKNRQETNYTSSGIQDHELPEQNGINSSPFGEDNYVWDREYNSKTRIETSEQVHHMRSSSYDNDDETDGHNTYTPIQGQRVPKVDDIYQLDITARSSMSRSVDQYVSETSCDHHKTQNGHGHSQLPKKSNNDGSSTAKSRHNSHKQSRKSKDSMDSALLKQEALLNSQGTSDTRSSNRLARSETSQVYGSSQYHKSTQSYSTFQDSTAFQSNDIPHDYDPTHTYDAIEDESRYLVNDNETTHRTFTDEAFSKAAAQEDSGYDYFTTAEEPYFDTQDQDTPYSNRSQDARSVTPRDKVKAKKHVHESSTKARLGAKSGKLSKSRLGLRVSLATSTISKEATSYHDSKTLSWDIPQHTSSRVLENPDTESYSPCTVEDRVWTGDEVKRDYETETIESAHDATNERKNHKRSSTQVLYQNNVSRTSFRSISNKTLASHRTSRLQEARDSPSKSQKKTWKQPKYDDHTIDWYKSDNLPEFFADESLGTDADLRIEEDFEQIQDYDHIADESEERASPPNRDIYDKAASDVEDSKSWVPDPSYEPQSLTSELDAGDSWVQGEYKTRRRKKSSHVKEVSGKKVRESDRGSHRDKLGLFIRLSSHTEEVQVDDSTIRLKTKKEKTRNSTRHTRDDIPGASADHGSRSSDLDTQEFVPDTSETTTFKKERERLNMTGEEPSPKAGHEVVSNSPTEYMERQYGSTNENDLAKHGDLLNEGTDNEVASQSNLTTIEANITGIERDYQDGILMDVPQHWGITNAAQYPVPLVYRAGVTQNSSTENNNYYYTNIVVNGDIHIHQPSDDKTFHRSYPALLKQSPSPRIIELPLDENKDSTIQYAQAKPAVMAEPTLSIEDPSSFIQENAQDGSSSTYPELLPPDEEYIESNQNPESSSRNTRELGRVDSVASDHLHKKEKKSSTRHDKYDSKYKRSKPTRNHRSKLDQPPAERHGERQEWLDIEDNPQATPAQYRDDEHSTAEVQRIRREPDKLTEIPQNIYYQPFIYSHSQVQLPSHSETERPNTRNSLDPISSGTIDYGQLETIMAQVKSQKDFGNVVQHNPQIYNSWNNVQVIFQCLKDKNLLLDHEKQIYLCSKAGDFQSATAFYDTGNKVGTLISWAKFISLGFGIEDINTEECCTYIGGGGQGQTYGTAIIDKSKYSHGKKRETMKVQVWCDLVEIADIMYGDKKGPVGRHPALCPLKLGSKPTKGE
jgi:hypothetical protein